VEEGSKISERASETERGAGEQPGRAVHQGRAEGRAKELASSPARDAELSSGVSEK
jgi:hypothetical protein